nr:MAG TPA: hypothetical protein [Siphoviridae sp. ctIwT7]
MLLCDYIIYRNFIAVKYFIKKNLAKSKKVAIIEIESNKIAE